MGSFSIWHWLIVFIVFVAPLFPIGRILKKAGYSRWLAIFYLIPLVNLVLLYVFAYSDWPKREIA